MKILLIIPFLFLVLPVECRRHLTALALVPCMQNSQLSATTFEVDFDPDSRQFSYNLDLTSNINGYVVANIDVYAYGFKIISKNIDLCSLSFKQFCPLYAGQVIVDSTETISEKYVDMIPNIAYTVPDIDGYAKISVKTANETTLACMIATFSNGKTVSHSAVKWVTAVIAGLGLLVSAILSSFGNSNAASHISVNSLTLFTYFQSVVISAMLHVQTVPPIASAWAENLAWSMGLIRIEFMQKIFRWYIQATGGSPTLFFNYNKKAILVQRSITNYLAKRAPALAVNNSDKLTVLRGIKRIGYNAHIEITSIVVTGFTFFVFFGYVLAVLVLGAKFLLEFLIRVKIIKNPNTAPYFRTGYKTILKGALLRYISIGFPQLTIFSLWEFTEHDSPAVVILAILFLALAVGILGWAAYRASYFGKTSVETYKNPAAILYGNQRVLDKYGFSYTMYNANKYWWGGALMLFTLVKAIFVGLCQSSGKTQSFIIFLLDLGYLIAVIRYKPFLDKSTNVLNIIIALVVCANSFMFVFFSNLFNQPGAVSSVMGWVFFILNAAFSLILLIIIIVYIATAILSKNPDARFRRAVDDRTSFQRNSTILLDEKGSGGRNFSRSLLLGSPNPGAEELLDLGKVAKNHQNDWESEIYKLKDMVNSKGDLMDDQDALQLRSKRTIEKLRSIGKADGSEDDTPIQVAKPANGTAAAAAAAASAFGSKLVHSLSVKRKNSQKNGPSSASPASTANNAVTSLSRTLSAMKMSRNNSKKLKTTNHSSAIPLTSTSNTYEALPGTNPNTPNLNNNDISVFSANVTQPVVSPDLSNDDFQFLNTSDQHSDPASNRNSIGGRYSAFNAFDKPQTTADFIGGSANTTMDSTNNSPFRGGYHTDDEHERIDALNGVSYGRKF